MRFLRRVLFGRPLPSLLHREPPSLPGPFSALSGRAHQNILKAADVVTGSVGAGAKEARHLLGRWRISKTKLMIWMPLTVIGSLVGGFAIMMVYYTMAFPDPLAIRKKDHAPVVRILARDGAVIAERGAAHEYMPLDLLPRHVPAAVVATEDRRFFEHYGLDPVGLARALFANLRAGRVAQGGSTLTQQLAKNLFLTSERTFGRKFEELGLALWLELRLSKQDILELYLNRVYFGGGAYGIEAASRRYFNKSSRQMTIAEAALIAGLLKAPSKFAPSSSPGAARARGRVVLTKMREAGVIGPSDYKRAFDERIVFHQPQTARDANSADYAIDYVLEQLPALVPDGNSEMVVETTLDAGLQKQASDIVSKAMDRDGARLGASQAAALVLDGDGGIRAMVGGRNYTDSQFNRAVKAKRQPGSAFKPFVYLTALERGLRPDSKTQDLPLTISGWAPRNDNGLYVGEVSLRSALAQSINTVAVRLHTDAGAHSTIEAARRLGIKSELRNEPSLALGTSETTLLEMTGAYGVFSNGGMAETPHIVTRVRMGTGKVLYVRQVEPLVELVSSAVTGAMNDVMNAALVMGTGKRAAFGEHPAGGKTGTTQDYRDAWFVGYTSHLTAGIWIGNDNGQPMNKAVGGGLPADMWREIMRVAHDGKAPLSLPGTVSRPLLADGPNAGVMQKSRVMRAIWIDDQVEQLPWLAAQPAVPQASPPQRAVTTAPVKVPVKAVAPKAITPVARRPVVNPPPQQTTIINKTAVMPPSTPLHPDGGLDDVFLERVLSDNDPSLPLSRPQGLMSLGGQ